MKENFPTPLNLLSGFILHGGPSLTGYYNKCCCQLWLFNPSGHRHPWSSLLNRPHEKPGRPSGDKPLFPDGDWTGMKDGAAERSDIFLQPSSVQPLTDLIPPSEKTGRHSFSLTFHTHSHMCTHTPGISALVFRRSSCASYKYTLPHP